MYTEEVNHASIQMNGTGRIQEDFDVGLIQGDTTSMYTGELTIMHLNREKRPYVYRGR